MADPLSRNYAVLTPPERFALMVEAMARDDQAEADRLEDTCPRQYYRHNDAEFRDRMQRSYTIALLMSVNLQKLLALVRCPNVFIEQHRVYADGPKLVAACALLYGRQYGLREAGAIERIEPPDPARIAAEVKYRPDLKEQLDEPRECARTRACGTWPRRCRSPSGSA